MPLLLSILLWRKERPASCNRPALTQPHPHLIHRNGKPCSARPASPRGRVGENESAPERRPFAGETGNGDVVPGGMRRGSVPGHVHVPLPPPARSWVGLAFMLAATPPPTRRRAVARPFQGRVSRQRLKAPGLNADHRRRVRTDSSNCSVRKSKPCIQARSGTTLAFAIG